MLLSHSANLVDARRSEEKNPLNATQGDKSEATLGADITSGPGKGNRPRAIPAFEVYEENQRSTGDTWDMHKSRPLVIDSEAEKRSFSSIAWLSHLWSRRFGPESVSLEVAPA